VLVDQTPIGRTPRSNPITYIKDSTWCVNCLLRSRRPSAFAHPDISRSTCRAALQYLEGDGTVTVEMQFLADWSCPARTATHALPGQGAAGGVQGQEHHDVLKMTVKEALRFFAGQVRLLENLPCWMRLGSAICGLGRARRRSQAVKRSV